MSKNKEIKDKELEDLKNKSEEYLQGWQRAKADYMNLKKETEEARSMYVKYANITLLEELLPIFDNLKLAIEHIPDEQKSLAWVVGIEHIKNQFNKFLEDNGVEQIKCVGEKFDPFLHEAVNDTNSVETRYQEDSEDKKESELPEIDDATKDQDGASLEQIIKKEVKAGYKLNGKVISPAKVIVE